MAETIGLALFAEGSSYAAFFLEYSAYINAALAFTASTAYGQHQRRKAQANARDAYNARLEDRLVMTATAQAARSRVYGRARNVDGILFKATHGTAKEFYTLVVAFAGHEVDAIEQLWVNDQPVTLDGSGYVLTTPWSDPELVTTSVNVTTTFSPYPVGLAATPVAGSVTVTTTQVDADSQIISVAVPFTVSGSTVSIIGGATSYTITYQWMRPRQRMRIRTYTGAPGQNLYGDLSALVGTAVQTSDRFAGIACAIVTMQYDTDAFPTGVPTITATLRGAKVLDPRTGTVAWTENPALIARDWALYANGGGLQSSDLVDAAFTAAANACDVSTTFTTAAGTETRPLYQAGTVIPLDGNPDDALGEIVEAMAGQWGLSGGKLTVRPGTYRAPVASITEDWIASTADISIVPQTGTAELINTLRPTFADAAQNYTSVPGADVESASAVAADGRVLARELTLGAVTRAVHAQHVCGVLLRENRDGLTVTLPCNMRAFALELFDVVAVTLPTFGWSAKAFEVLGWEFTLTGGVSLTLREVTAANYTVDSLLDIANSSPNSNLPTPLVVAQVTGVAVTSGTTALSDGSVTTRTQVTWSPVTSEAVRASGYIEVQTLDLTTLATGAMPVDWPSTTWPGTAASAVIVGLRRNAHHLVRVRAANSLGVRGQWSTQVVHQVAGVRPGNLSTLDQVNTADIVPGAATVILRGFIPGPVSRSSSA